MEQITLEKGYNLYELDVRKYAAGIYFLSLRDANKRIITTQKLIVH